MPIKGMFSYIVATSDGINKAENFLYEGSFLIQVSANATESQA